MNVIETERLTLRGLTAGDAPFVREMLNDPDFIRNVADRGVRTLEDARRYISERIAASYERFGFGLWLVEVKETKEAAGVCGLVKRDSLPGVDIGFAFLPRFRSKGYASESASAVKDYATRVLRLRPLFAIVSPGNAGSIRVLEKIGLNYERDIRMPGEEHDILLFSSQK